MRLPVLAALLIPVLGSAPGIAAPSAPEAPAPARVSAFPPDSPMTESGEGRVRTGDTMPGRARGGRRAADAEDKFLLAAYPNWGRHAGLPASKVPYGLLTHIVYSDFTVDPSGALRNSDLGDAANLAELVELAHAAGVKVSLSVRASGAGFEAMARKAAARTRFIRSCLAAAAATRADGIDLAWDLISAGNSDHRLALVRELRLALDAGPRRLLLSSSVSSDERWAGAHEDEFFVLPDLLTVVTSGFDGREGRVRPVSGLADAEEALRGFEKRGVIAERILLESPFFGRSFDGASGLGSGYAGKGSGNDGSWRWKDLLIHLRGAEYKILWDEASRSESAVGRGEAIVFLGIPSQRARGERLRAASWGGAAVLDLASDTLDARKSLLAALSAGLRGLPKGLPVAVQGHAEAAAPPAISAAPAAPVELVTDHLMPGMRVHTRSNSSRPLVSMAEGIAKEGGFALEAVLPAGSGCALCAASPVDLAGARAGWELQFWIRGEDGDEGVHIGFEDDGVNEARMPLKARVNVRSHAPVRRGEWTRADIPLPAFGTRGTAETPAGPRFGTFHWSGVRCLTLDADLGRRDPVRFRLDAVRVAPAGALSRGPAGPGYATSNEVAARERPINGREPHSDSLAPATAGAR